MRKERKMSKSNLLKKVISGTLAFVLVATSMPLLSNLSFNSMIVEASTGSSGGGGAGLTGGGTYDHYEVIAIYPSKLLEASSASDLTSIKNRYNNFQNYPILFRVGSDSAVDNPDTSRNTVMVYPNSSDASKLLDPSWKSGKYVNESKSYKSNDSDVSFFYKSIKDCINNPDFADPDVYIDASKNMGEKFNSKFGSGTAKKWSANNYADMHKFFRGFKKVLKDLYSIDDSKLNTLFGANGNGECKSFLVERYFSLGGKNLYSSACLATVCAAGAYKNGNDGGAVKAFFRENDAFFGKEYQGRLAGSTYQPLTGKYVNIIKAELKSIYPKITQNNKTIAAKVDNTFGTSYSFAGWGFFELTHGGTSVTCTDRAWVKSQVTYNAYLGDVTESESAEFGKNGLVTSDLVSVSSVEDYDLLGGYYKFIVDDSIQLDTPYTGAKFDLNKLSYRVTNPQGTKVLFYDKTQFTQNDSLSVGRTYALLKAYLNAKPKDLKVDNFATTYSMNELYEVTDESVISALNKAYPNYTHGENKAVVPSTKYSLVRGNRVSYGKDENTDRERLYTKLKGKWYYCPVTAETNMLIQVRADYLKKYTKDEVGKVQTMQSYLLAKRYDLQEDFVNDNLEALRTMIDAYPTTLWGAIRNRTVQSSIQDESGNVTAIDLQNVVNGYFRYNLRKSGDKHEVVPIWGSDNVKKDDWYYNKYNTQTKDTKGNIIKEVAVSGEQNKYNNSLLENNVHFGTSSGQISPLVQTLFNGNGVKNNTASNDSAPVPASSSKNMIVSSLLYHGGVVNGKYVAGKQLTKDSWLLSDSPVWSTKGELALNTRGYKATDFSKLVAKYSKTYSFVRGKNASATAPNVASWTANGLQDTYKSVLGLNTADIGKNVSTASAKSSTSSKLYDYGFARLGLGGKIIYNNSSNPASIVDVELSVGGSGGQKSAISNLMNSSVDIPLRVKWEQYFTGERKSTVKSSISSSLKVNPEVTMWYQGSSGSYGSVVTAGDYIREIPVVPYNTLSIKNDSSDPKVTGTSVALDARAKVLAGKLANEDTPVLYSGSGVTLTYDKVPSVELTSYLIDIDDSHSNLKSAWGNNYNAETAIRSMVSNAIAKGDIKSDLTVNGQKLTLKELKDCTLKAGDSKLEETWYLTVKGGEITSVKVNGEVFGAGSFSVASGKPHEIATALKEMKLLGKDNILSQVFAKGAGEKITDSGLKSWLTSSGQSKYLNDGWYYEDTSVLVVKKFKTDFALSDTTISDKLPMNLGPQTPADRNQFFSDGYTATADLATSFRIDIAGVSLSGNSSTDRVSEKKVDFIIPDVSIKDSYGV